MRPIIVDIAEFMANPLRSGIQRVVRELVVKWPADVPVVFARYDAATDGLVRVSSRALRRAIDHPSERSMGRVPIWPNGASLPLSGREQPLSLLPDDVVLVPEVFYEPRRVAFYDDVLSDHRWKIGFVVFDFIPWLKPSEILLGSASSNWIMPYLMLVVRARHRCFISIAVRDEFVSRIVRSASNEAGPVIPLGADSFNLRKKSFSPDLVDVVCIGTLDGKKGQNIVFDAFKQSKGRQRGRLVCLGKIPERPAPWMRELLDCSRDDVVIVDSPSEDAIVASMERARATAFVSTNEGFGLPAVESLHCGVPLVAHEKLPCLSGLPTGGQIRLPRITVDAVARALARLANDDEARELWSQAADLHLQTWHEYAESLADWTLALAGRDSKLQSETGRRRYLPTATAASEAGLDHCD